VEQRPLADRVAAVSALDEPIRRALFEHVSRGDTPVSRDDAAEAVGLARSTAAFHDSFQNMLGSLHARARQLNRR
jgi:hypothetical protein